MNQTRIEHVDTLENHTVTQLFNLYISHPYPEKEVEPYPTVDTFIKGIQDETAILVYTNKDTLIGFATFTPTTGFIHLLNVKKTYRNQGVATMIINTIDTICTNNGYNKELRLITDNLNTSAQAFYEARGFIGGPIKAGKLFKQTRQYTRPLAIDPTRPLNISLRSADTKAKKAGMIELEKRGLTSLRNTPFRIVQEHANGFINTEHLINATGQTTIKTVFEESLFVVDTNKYSHTLNPQTLIAYIHELFNMDNPETKQLKAQGFHIHVLATCLDYHYFDIDITAKNGEETTNVVKKEQLVVLPEQTTLLDWII